MQHSLKIFTKNNKTNGKVSKKGRQKWRAKRAILLMRPFWRLFQFFVIFGKYFQRVLPYRLGRLGCGRRPHEKRERNLFSHPIFSKYFRKFPKIKPKYPSTHQMCALRARRTSILGNFPESSGFFWNFLDFFTAFFYKIIVYRY